MAKSTFYFIIIEDYTFIYLKSKYFVRGHVLVDFSVTDGNMGKVLFQINQTESILRLKKLISAYFLIALILAAFDIRDHFF